MTLAQDIANWRVKSLKDIEYVARSSVEDTLRFAAVEGPSEGPPRKPGRGGRMPVQSGNLRESLYVRSPDLNADRLGNGGESIAAGAVKIGSIATFGWAAPYAAAVEYGVVGPARAFLRGALQKWPSFIRARIAEVSDG